jgi:GT2 family glycosyltransferase
LVIAVYNRLDLTRACLDSVFACWDTDPFDEILIVDDCSTDGTAEWLASLGTRVTVLTNTERSGFGLNMNRAAAVSTAEFLVLLNNDTIVTPNWSRIMLREALADPAIGVVGNRQLHADGASINHAGLVFDHLFRPRHLYFGEAPDFPPALANRPFQAVTGACWLLRRALFLELEGFDPAFRNGWEDVDFCLRARARGWTIWYAGESVIRHHVSASEGRHDHEDENAALFRSRWKGMIEPDMEVVRARDGQPPSRVPIEELGGQPSPLMNGLRRIRRLPLMRQAVDRMLHLPGITALADHVARRLRRP